MTLEHCTHYKDNLEKLLDDEQLLDATSSVSASLVEQFTSGVLDTNWTALRSLHELLRLVDKVIDYVESCGGHAS